jgi:alcohol dehydrogenase class IV
MSILYPIRKFVAPEFIFGVGSRHKVGFYARNMMAQKVLIVSDLGVIAAGWVKGVQSDLKEVGIESVVFHELTPNPKDYEVMAGAAFYAKIVFLNLHNRQFTRGRGYKRWPKEKRICWHWT